MSSLEEASVAARQCPRLPPLLTFPSLQPSPPLGAYAYPAMIDIDKRGGLDLLTAALTLSDAERRSKYSNPTGRNGYDNCRKSSVRCTFLTLAS
jgi:hypothetical protein